MMATGVAVARDPAYTWHNVTVGGGGFSPAIIFSHAEAGLAYLRTDIGGVYRWNQADGTWQPLQDGFADGNYFGIESIALDRHDPKVVYAAAGMYHSFPAALLRSTNRGQSWSIFPVPFRMGANEDGRGVGERLSLDPNDPDILYFGSRFDGLQRSSNRGASWEKVASFPYAGEGVPAGRHTRTGISFVVFDPRTGHVGSPTGTVFVGVAESGEHHIFRTQDAGVTWSAVPAPPRQDLLPVQARLDGGVLYVTYSNSTGPGGASDGAVYRLNTGTDRWTDITPDRPASSGYMGLSLDPQQPGTLLVASLDRYHSGDAIWRSHNGGESWQNLRELSTRDVSTTPFLTWGDSEPTFGWWMASVAVDPFDSSHVAYTTGATVYATHQLGAADTGRDVPWKPWVKGVEETAVITLTSPPAGPHLYSGFGDIGGYAHLDLAVSPPMFDHPALDNTNSIDYAGINPAIVVRSGAPRHNGTSLAWSADYGRSWQPITAPASDVANTAALISSADGAVFVLMTPIPQLSRDHGRSWLPLRLPAYSRVISDRVDPQRLYALDFHAATLWSSSDAGLTFTPLSSEGLPHTLSSDEPTSPEMPVPLLAVPGKTGDLWLISQGRLFHSLDGGSHFRAVGNDLRITRLSFGKEARGHAYPDLYAIGARDTLVALWRSEDGGSTWVRINDSRHEYGRRFRCIAGDPRIHGRVYVGTDGRGIIYGDSTD